MVFAIARSRGRQWTGERDRHFGPFTFASERKGGWRPLALILDSGKSSGCHLRMQAFGWTLICEMPAVIKPWRRWVDLSGKGWAKNADGSPPGYWDVHPREYGFTLNDGFLSVKFGAQTMDSSTTDDWGWFLPWTQWRTVADRLYHADGTLAADVAGMEWTQRFAVQDAVTRHEFQVEDFDGELVTVRARYRETERRLGTGWFKWLGYLRPKKVYRGLDLAFGKEVGCDKGSWKGGMVGHSTAVLPGETPEQAMRRYCEQEHRAKHGTYKLRFVGAA